MIETLAIVAIFGSCGLLTWAAMKKYSSKIKQRLDEIDLHTTQLEMAKRQPKR